MQPEHDRCPSPRPTRPAFGELERLRSPLGLLFGRDQGASGEFSAELAAVREARACLGRSPAPPSPEAPALEPGVASRWLRRLRSALARRPRE